MPFISLFALVLFSFQSESPTTQNKGLRIVPAGSALVLRGEVGENPINVSGSLYLMPVAASAAQLMILPSRLEIAQPNKDLEQIYIERSALKVFHATPLTPNTPNLLTLQVEGVTRPGHYTGDLAVFIPGQSEEILSIPIQMDIKATPRLKFVNSIEKLQVVVYSTVVGEALSSFFFPRNGIERLRPIKIENKTRAPVKLLGMNPVLVGSTNGETVDDLSISSSFPITLPPTEVSSLMLDLQKLEVLPDSYEGTLHFKVEGMDAPLELNTEMKVRVGPFLPIAVMLLGVLIGRSRKFLDSPEGKLQVELMQFHRELQHRVDALSDDKTRNAFRARLTWLYTKLNGPKPDLESLKVEGEHLSGELDFLDDIAGPLNTWSEEGIPHEGLEHCLENHRQAIINGDRDAAKKARELIKQELTAAAQDLQEVHVMKSGFGVRGDMDTLTAAGTADVIPGKKDAAEKAVDAHDQPSWLGRKFQVVVDFFFGKNQPKAAFTYRFLYPMVRLSTFAVVLLMGLQTLYIDAGDTFGDSGVYDYLGLFLWGVSTDIARQSLPDLTGEKKGDKKQPA